jgi:endonuclease/exonuclease/phosphatase family metal-dependent hydrolase
MRIATWNIERPPGNLNARSGRILEKLREINADIWILTETHDNIRPGQDYQEASTPTVTDPPIFHREGEHKTTVWSRWPIVDRFEPATPIRAVSPILETPLGRLVLYGTVLPYHGARWPYGTRRNWDAHYAAIATQGADWSRLRRDYPVEGLCVAGDFNQNRPQRTTYGTRWGRVLLDLAFKESDLVGVTQADSAAARQLPQADLRLIIDSIDHICLNSSWAKKVTRVGIWPGQTGTGEYLSDHSGVFIDLKADD